MKRYRKMTSRLWDDPHVGQLSDAAILLFVYIVTHPQQTALGAFRGTPAGLASERRWTIGKLRKALDQLIAEGMVEVDESACYVGVPDFFIDNPPESPNVVTSWRTALEYVPRCRLRTGQLERARRVAEQYGPGFVVAFDKQVAALDTASSEPDDGGASPRQLSEGTDRGFPKGFGEPFADPLPKGSPNREPDTDQEPEQEREGEPEPDLGRSSLSKELASVRASPNPRILEPLVAELVGADDGFDAFWSHYPKKKAKEAARREWEKLAPSQKLRTQIHTSIDESARSTEWLRDEGQYIPHPTKWLRERRWEDEPVQVPFMTKRTIQNGAAFANFRREPVPQASGSFLDGIAKFPFGNHTSPPKVVPAQSKPQPSLPKSGGDGKHETNGDE